MRGSVCVCIDGAAPLRIAEEVPGAAGLQVPAFRQGEESLLEVGLGGWGLATADDRLSEARACPRWKPCP